MLVPVGAHCHAPSAPCPPSPLLPPFACSSRDPIATRYEKLYKRIGFLFFAYNKGYWWFEPVLLLYKLSMTVLILFVSDGDENKSLVRVCALLCLLCVNLPTALTVHSLLLLCSVA